MEDWTSGYVADIDYTFGYYPELNPLRAETAFLSNGIVCPKFEFACELGFGQGLSTNIHAAASSASWYGTDFNPAQAGFARELSRVSETGAHHYDEAFVDFCARTDLPDFEFIGLHGIWSWISDSNRHIIVDFIRRKLKVGGVLYVSYNTLPGWSNFAPIRHLMTRHVDVIGSSGRGIVSSIDGAIEFAENFLATNPLYAQANPLIVDRLKQLKAQNRHYLAHEYFNRDWHPMHFATMADWLEPAKLTFACSAQFMDYIDVVNLTTEQKKFLLDIPDEMLRQSVRDFMVNQQFRKDYWVKGGRRLSPLERREMILKKKYLLTDHSTNIPLKINGAAGEANLSENIYTPLLETLNNYKPKSMGQLVTDLKKDGIELGQLNEALMILANGGHLSGVQDEDEANTAKSHTEMLNDYILNKSRSGGEINFLASPVTGGGIAVERFAQLFVLAIKEGKKTPEEWALSAWHALDALGQKIIMEGGPLESGEENIAELNKQAAKFAAGKLPVLKATGVL